MSMTESEAWEILHPYTTRRKLAKIEYYAGFNGKLAVTKAVDEACVVACNALEEVQIYRATGTIEECTEAIKKQKPKKARDISGDGIKRYVCECGNLMHGKQAYCEKCGQRLED